MENARGKTSRVFFDWYKLTELDLDGTVPAGIMRNVRVMKARKGLHMPKWERQHTDRKDLAANLIDEMTDAKRGTVEKRSSNIHRFAKLTSTSNIPVALLREWNEEFEMMLEYLGFFKGSYCPFDRIVWTEVRQARRSLGEQFETAAINYPTDLAPMPKLRSRKKAAATARRGDSDQPQESDKRRGDSA